MAWTAPKTWSVGELVTAANMNTHVRDNLSYLKGGAGAITLDNILGVGTAPTYGIDLLGSTESASSLRITRSDSGTRGLLMVPPSIANQYVKIAVDGGTSVPLTFWTGTTPGERMRLTDAGDMGLGTTSPQGRLHLRDTISGLIHWEYDGVDGTARTVIPDGAGDVLYGLSGLSVSRSSTGVADARTFALSALSTNFTLYNDGTNTLTFFLNANGSATVQRTAGTATFKSSLWILWL